MKLRGSFLPFIVCIFFLLVHKAMGQKYCEGWDNDISCVCGPDKYYQFFDSEDLRDSARCVSCVAPLVKYETNQATDCYVEPCGPGLTGPGGSCTSCVVGKYKSHRSSYISPDACTECSIGKYSAATGLSTSESCVAGKYAGSGQSSCLVCSGPASLLDLVNLPVLTRSII